MTEMLNNLLMLLIMSVYCQLLIALAFIVGQLMILVVEYAADWIEGRQSRADKQAKAMPYRAKTYR